MKCSKCKNDTFKIEVKKKCDDCEHNGAQLSIDVDYIYAQQLIDELGLERNEALDDGECEYGSNFNYGCYMFTCTQCKNEEINPMMEQ